MCHVLGVMLAAPGAFYGKCDMVGVRWVMWKCATFVTG